MSQLLTASRLARPSIFDLLLNPFALLNLASDADRNAVADAFEDALADAAVSEEVLREARRQLLAPRPRLQATAEFFPDAMPDARVKALAALQGALPQSEQIALAKSLPPYSRSIYLSQIGGMRTSSGLLRFFMLSCSQIDKALVASSLADLVEGAGSPRPQLDAAIEAVNDVIGRSADRLISVYPDASNAAADVAQSLEDVLSEATDDQVAGASVVVDAYVKMAGPALQVARRLVEDAAEAIRQGPELPGATKVLIDALVDWDAIAQPQQVLASHKGRDDPGARDLYQFLRGLMLELTNDNDKPRTALEINGACLEVFAELPRAEQQLREDRASLEDLVSQEGAKELGVFVETMKKDLDPLVRDLNLAGFSDKARGVSAQLYGLLSQAVARTRGTSADGLPWGLARVLALEINNELGEATASQKLLEGLGAHPHFGSAPQDMRQRILTDLATVRSNVLNSKLNRAVEKKDQNEVKRILQDLVSVATDANERRQYQDAIQTIEAAKSRRVISWIVWGVIILGVIGYSVSQSNRPASSTYRPPSASTNAPVALQGESKPPVGTNRSFSRSNLRYCMYQSMRLDAAQAAIANETNDGVIGAFKSEIDDYNSRCGNYRYYDDDLAAVRSELANKSSTLAAEGRKWVQTWRSIY